MMQMLVAGGIPAVTDAARTADEDNPHGYFEIEAVKSLKRDSAWLAEARGRVIKVIHLLLMDLPAGYRYRVVFMHRDLDEVVASQRKMLERSGRAGGALEPEALKRQYQAQLARVDAWLASQPHFSRLDVSYNELLARAEPVVSRVAAFVGRAGREAELMRAIDAGLYRNRKG